MTNFLKQHIHDKQQAERRTREQNQKIVEIITANGTNGMWGYSDVAPEGGSVELHQTTTNKRWIIDREGNVTEPS